MINETSSPRGAVMLGFIWISWQLEWKLEKVSERWNRLPVAERFYCSDNRRQLDGSCKNGVLERN